MSKRSDELGFPLYMTSCALIAAIGGFNVGWHISVPNMPQTTIMSCEDIDLDKDYGALPPCLPMSSFTWGYTVGAYALGGLAGSFSTMYMNVWLPRRINIMISCAWFIFGGILSACAVNIGMYAVGRALVGFGAGMAGSSIAIYISEVSTKKSRGALGSVFEFFLNLGILLTQVCGRYMKAVPVWRFLWGIPSILAAINLALMFFYCVESPRRLCADGKIEEARHALQRLRGDADISDEFENLLAARQREKDSNVKKMNIIDVITLKDRHVSWMVFVVVVIQAYNQVGGIGPLSVYAVGFLQSVLHDVELAQNVSLANATGKLVATFICVIWLHKVGRKMFMMLSTMGMTISCIFIVIGAVLGEGLGPLVICGAILFTFTYALGCGTIPWIIAPELVPLSALAPGSALGCVSNWLFNFLINTLWPQQSANLGSYSFTVFAAINFIGFLFCFFW
ncbi:general substrate transporter [Circinella umbellata]|nr:general substrate transporter [Circinella umbellata]